MTIAIVRAGLVRVALIAEGERELLPSRSGAEGLESSLDAAVLVRCS
jgi:hypothetical protein